MTDPSAPGFAPRPVARTAAAEQIADQIRDAMRNGRLASGDRLPSEHDLAREFEVSRPTVREAIRLLSADELVRSTRGAGGGTFVVLPQRDGVARRVGEAVELWFQAGSTTTAEVDFARAWIERGCVRLAAEARTAEELEAIAAPLEASREPSLTTNAFLALDIEFHVAISRAAHNAVMELAMTAIHRVRPRTNTLLIPELQSERIVAQHDAIYRAIRDGDPDAAERAHDAHVAYLQEVQRAVLAERDAATIPIASLAEAHPAG